LTYFDKLRAASLARDSQLCVGLDPDPELIPGGAAGAARFCIGIVEATREVACCYKPNSAYWEQYGPEGWPALLAVRAAIPADIPVILDAKRSDIPSTMGAYARAVFDKLGFDAVTVHAYHGTDSLEQFTARRERGVYVVCHTSNPGAEDLQDLRVGGSPLFIKVAELGRRLGERSGNVGLVVGATFPEQVAAVRAVAPEAPLLLPGVGSQGGDLEATVRAAWNGDAAGCLVSVSRAVMYDPDPAGKARQLRDDIRRHVPAPA
jgi:orotidine 5'-phosphate decarboxylase subfamily 2